MKPSEAELRILHVLWNRGPSAVRDVFAQLEKSTGVGYTTILKLMQIMLEKNLVSRDESSRRHVYSAKLTRSEAEERFVGDLVDSVFNGSKKRLVLQLLDDAKSSQEELEEIRRTILQFEKGGER